MVAHRSSGAETDDRTLSVATGDMGVMPDLDPPPGGILPPLWSSPSSDTLAHALDVTRGALSPTGSRDVYSRLTAYYDRSGGALGSLFTALNPNMLQDVTPTDLLAMTTFCGALSPRLIRRILEPSPRRSALLRALHELPDDDLAAASVHRLLAMENLQLAARDAFRSSTELQETGRTWDPATVLCARKRGDLFPNPSHSVRSLLGLLPGPLAYRQTWLIYRFLLRSDEVRRRLFAILESLDDASDYSVVPDHGVLSILDATLNIYAN